MHSNNTFKLLWIFSSKCHINGIQSTTTFYTKVFPFSYNKCHESNCKWNEYPRGFEEMCIISSMNLYKNIKI